MLIIRLYIYRKLVGARINLYKITLGNVGFVVVVILFCFAFWISFIGSVSIQMIIFFVHITGEAIFVVDRFETQILFHI